MQGILSVSRVWQQSGIERELAFHELHWCGLLTCTVKVAVFLPFENGLNVSLWCCSYMTPEYIMKKALQCHLFQIGGSGLAAHFVSITQHTKNYNLLWISVAALRQQL